MLRKKLIGLCLLLCCLFDLSASDYPVKYLGIEHGLSNNAVTSIFQDRKGFMWFGTYDGLNRYDGYNFQVFRNRVGDSASLIGNSIYTIAGDSKDNLWVGGQKGACVLDSLRKNFTSLKFITADTKKVEWLRDDIHNILVTRNDIVLIGTNHRGLIVFDKDSRTGHQIELPAAGPDYDATAIETDPSGTFIWVFVQKRGLFRFDLISKKLSLVNSDIKEGNCLRRSREGNLWLGNERGLFEYNVSANTYSANRIATTSKIVHIKEDKIGLLWIASDGDGLLVMNKIDAIAHPFAGADGRQLINSNAVYSVYEDIEGRKWIGTLRGGINTIEANPDAFQLINFTHSSYRSPATNFILSFAEDKKNNLWIGTDGAGLRFWDRNTNNYAEYFHTEHPGSISSNFITSIVSDASNTTWIATWLGGINRFDAEKKQFVKYFCYNPVTRALENNIWVLYLDAWQRLWAGATNDGSLYLYNTQRDQFELFDNKVRNLQCMAEDRHGNLWGGNYNELIKIDRVNKQHQVFTIGYTIRSIHEDTHNRLWVGTQEGGLLLFDRSTGKYQRFTMTEGLSNNTVLRMLEDDKGFLWISTFNGLCRFDPEKKVFRNFFQSDGLQSNQFSFNAGLAMNKGEFAFGGINGFNLFYPDSVQIHTVQPKIFLTGLLIDNAAPEENPKQILPTTAAGMQQIRVPFDRAVFSLSFLALDYSSADKISYAYYLEGWDKSWNNVGNIRTANYSRLQEGTYLFKVKAKSQDGNWGPETTLLRISVLPPWYRTWWAYASYVLILALGIYLYLLYSRRQERLKYEIKLAHLENEKDKELNEKKLSFFTNISHEFRSPLSLIINPLKDFLSKKNENKNGNDLNIAYRNARRLLGLVDQLLLFRKADSGADILKVSRFDIIHLCNEVYQCFVQQARNRGMQYNFNTAKEKIELHGDYEKIEIALFNLLSNAFKYTGDGGVINITINQEGELIKIIINDTGCGFDMAESDRIFGKFQQASSVRSQKAGFGIGLYLVKHFIESHNGTIEVNSQLNQGTSFTISLQTGTKHLPAQYITDESGQSHELLDELVEETMQEPELPVMEEQGRSADETITEKKTLLVVDDNTEIREYMRQLFGDKYILFTADNGDTGLQMALRHFPDLIITDISMTGIDGIELCTRVKKSEMLAHIPVILLTAASSSEVKLKGIEGGADDYITKPFDSKLLQARVETILKNRNRLQRYFFDHITLQESTIKVPSEYREFLKDCIRVVEENLDTEDFTILKFSRAMGMSRSSLYQKIKNISGQSPNAFIRSIRLRRAAVLIIKENMNVNQAAFQVGIGDARYFREQFNKLFGMTPSDYRKKYRLPFSGEMNLLRPETE